MTFKAEQNVVVTNTFECRYGEPIKEGTKAVVLKDEELGLVLIRTENNIDVYCAHTSLKLDENVEKCKYCGNTSIRCCDPRVVELCQFYIDQHPHEETVNHPAHYGGDTPYEVVKVLRAWLTPEQYAGFLIGNAFKYMARYRMKGGKEDVQKASWYINRFLEEGFL